ncbi:MAG: hypothetical protein ABFD16_04570 [Thermoguttaceae bacterium]|jgi:hypothetical protein
MAEEKRVVAVISPWAKLSDLVKKKFRVETLPAEKKVMVWREDLETKDQLLSELTKAGITDAEVRPHKVTAKWQDVQ